MKVFLLTDILFSPFPIIEILPLKSLITRFPDGKVLNWLIDVAKNLLYEIC